MDHVSYQKTNQLATPLSVAKYWTGSRRLVVVLVMVVLIGNKLKSDAIHFL